ncbi:MAG: hypothetical protein WDO74_28545 [Pseudomonadota bacterium]
MKSSTGFAVVVVTLCALPFQACTNADVEFSSVSAAGSEPAPRAGAGGNDSSVAGTAGAGFGATLGDAGTSGVSGDAGEASVTGGSGAAGSGNGGMPSAGGGQAGNAGRGGGASGNGGSAGGSGGGAGASGGGAGGSSGGGGTSGGGTSGGGTSSGGTSGGAGRGGGGGAGAGGSGGAPAVCGNALLESGEQCDDGNRQSLDACDASCAFEQSQRANSFELEFVTSDLCPNNAFGAAFARSAKPAFQASLSDRVADGSLSLLFAFRGLGDLTGTSAETISLAVLSGAPVVAPNYDGTSDRDWWYRPAADQVDSSGELLSNLPASLSAGVLRVNTGNIQLPLLSGGAVNLSSTKLRLNIGNSSKPLASSGAPPGHLASEHLSASLVSFAAGGLPADGDPGELCGDISAASLAAVAIPAAFASGGSAPCTQGYAAARSFLDLLVGGCTLAPGGEVIVATQPDQTDPGAPPARAGAPYTLTRNATSHAVTGCRDKNNAVAPLATCLKAAAFSSAYRFKTGRVIIK